MSDHTDRPRLLALARGRIPPLIRTTSEDAMKKKSSRLEAESLKVKESSLSL
jgi:hypothetical protein